MVAAAEPALHSTMKLDVDMARIRSYNIDLHFCIIQKVYLKNKIEKCERGQTPQCELLHIFFQMKMIIDKKDIDDIEQ